MTRYNHQEFYMGNEQDLPGEGYIPAGQYCNLEIWTMRTPWILYVYRYISQIYIYRLKYAAQ